MIYLDFTPTKNLSVTHCKFLSHDKHQGVMD